MKKLASILLALLVFISSTTQTRANLIESIEGGIALSIWGCSPTLTDPSLSKFKPTVVQGTKDLITQETWVYKCESPTAGTSLPYDNNPRNDGALASVNGLIGGLYSNPPASTGYYVADLIQNSPLVPQTYAQGLGFGSLLPILEVWKAFRNMAYFLFAIVFTFIGFAIMFRAKLNPQTVVNIQSAIPKLVVTLILITFSYAIAGLMIDLMYVSIYLIIGLFDPLLDKNLTNIAFEKDIFSNYLGFFGNSVWDASGSVGDIVQEIIGDNILGEVVDIIADLTALIIISIALLIAMFRTFFSLLSVYIQIILSIIFSPIQILMNALPNSNSFTSWLRNLAANLAVFPAVITIIFLAYTLTGQGGSFVDVIGSTEGNGGFIPPQIPGRGTASTMQAIIAMAMILTLPEVINKTKEALSGGGGGRGGGGGFAGAFAGAGLGSAIGNVGMAGKFAGAGLAYQKPIGAVIGAAGKGARALGRAASGGYSSKPKSIDNISQIPQETHLETTSSGTRPPSTGQDSLMKDQINQRKNKK